MLLFQGVVLTKKNMFLMKGYQKGLFTGVTKESIHWKQMLDKIRRGNQIQLIYMVTATTVPIFSSTVSWHMAILCAIHIFWKLHSVYKLNLQMAFYTRHSQEVFFQTWDSVFSSRQVQSYIQEKYACLVFDSIPVFKQSNWPRIMFNNYLRVA